MKTTKIFNKKDLSSMFTLALFTIIFGVFFGNFLFGDRSIVVYYKLKKERNALKKEIYELKLQNSFLKKGILELQSLQVDN